MEEAKTIDEKMRSGLPSQKVRVDGLSAGASRIPLWLFA